MSRLKGFLRPRSIAVIGASRKKGSLGHMFLSALVRMDFSGQLLPVNPQATEIEGVRCFASIESLPENVDLAVVLLPYRFVEETLRVLATKGIKNVIVVSAGFREVGPDGAEREENLKRLATELDLTLIGPNCMGVFNTDPEFRLNATFSPTPPAAGHIAFLSQSGALGVAVLELSIQKNLGYSVFVSTGNKVDIDETDVLEFLAEDQNTRVVMLYLESIDRPHAFMQIARKLVIQKPVLAVKAGRGEKAMAAAASHTGAMASPDRVVDAFLKQCGVVRCETLEEMLDLAQALEQQPLPAGDRIAVISNAGGPLILATDAIEREGLSLPCFPDDVQQQLRTLLPEEAAVRNPVDMIASATHDVYQKVFEIVAGRDEVDAILLIVVKPPVATSPREVAQSLSGLVQTMTKPVVAVVMQHPDEEAGLEVFEALGIPVYSYPERAVKVMSGLTTYARFASHRAAPVLSNPPCQLQEGTPEQLPANRVFDLLGEFGIDVAPLLVTVNVEDAVRFAGGMKAPVALKIANREIIHKSDVGLVRLNLSGDDRVRAGFEEIARRARTLLRGAQPRILVQPMVTGFPELVVGSKKIGPFGPVLMFGVGGTLVEALGDVAFRVAPVGESEAREMLSEIRGQSMLKGFRGHARVDESTIAALITKVSRLMMDHPEIIELDLNPVIWSPDRREAVVVDARMTAIHLSEAPSA